MIKVKHIGGSPVSWGLIVHEIRLGKKRHKKNATQLFHESSSLARAAFLAHSGPIATAARHSTRRRMIACELTGRRWSARGCFGCRLASLVRAISFVHVFVRRGHSTLWPEKRDGASRADTAAATTINQHTMYQSFIALLSWHLVSNDRKRDGTHHVVFAFDMGFE